MSDKTALGDRMKELERRETGRRCLSGVPVCVRIDGKRFSRWTEGLERPFDPRLSSLMLHVASRLVTETSAVVGYTQSDEISLLLEAPHPRGQLYLDGRIQKLVSVLASLATALFNAELGRRIPERAERPALFDCRVWEVPSREEAVNVLLWRERDATKNSLSMAARHHYPHAELTGRAGPELHELLHAKGVNWNDYPPFFKRGVFVRRRVLTRPFDDAERASLPEKHAARRDPTLAVERVMVAPVDMPPFDTVRNRVAVIFEGADPEVG